MPCHPQIGLVKEQAWISGADHHLFERQTGTSGGGGSRTLVHDVLHMNSTKILESGMGIEPMPSPWKGDDLTTCRTGHGEAILHSSSSLWCTGWWRMLLMPVINTHILGNASPELIFDCLSWLNVLKVRRGGGLLPHHLIEIVYGFVYPVTSTDSV